MTRPDLGGASPDLGGSVDAAAESGLAPALAERPCRVRVRVEIRGEGGDEE